jgi:hypothetical protein
MVKCAEEASVAVEWGIHTGVPMAITVVVVVGGIRVASVGGPPPHREVVVITGRLIVGWEVSTAKATSPLQNYKIITLYMTIVGGEPTPEEIAAAKAIEDRKVVAMTKLRSERDALFPATDKYVMRDYPINDETFKKWKRYRQHLRDLPGMSSPDLDEDGNLTGVEWPAAPTS